MPYCTKCGEKIIEGNAFCIKCGEKIHIPKAAIQRNMADDTATMITDDNHTTNVSVFVAPSEDTVVNGSQNSIQQSVPTFTPPADNDVVGNEVRINNSNDDNGGVSNNTPIFTPPTPTFTPPVNAKPSFNGPTCSYHPGEPAVAKCARCGKYICQDCFDNYGVVDGQYKDKALCYDCCKTLVAENVADLKKNKAKIMVQFIVSLVGIVAGLIIGISIGIDDEVWWFTGIAGAAVGGVFLSASKVFLSLVWDVIKIAVSGNFGFLTFLSIIWNILKLIFQSLIATIKNTVYYITYLKDTSGFIESDSEALRQMDDYMEYTLIRNQNRGVDIETLLNQKSELADNSYAHMVQEKGEEGAEAALRDCVATINENGEIIRSFRENGRNAA